jgi:formylglycine-generating enzyme required for sulfatase activity
MPQGYCIDSTEVTQAQYQAWLATSPHELGGSACSQNATYMPSCQWDPTTQGTYPVVCVTWCDAYAYCQGVGKRLCGKIGGGPLDFAAYADASQGQWYNACSSNGAYQYVYGNTYDAVRCNGADKNIGTIVPVGQLTACVSSASGYGGVFDLTGNVNEWIDSCSGDLPTDECRTQGGSFVDSSPYMICSQRTSYSSRGSGAAAANVGFRCCSP